MALGNDVHIFTLSYAAHGEPEPPENLPVEENERHISQTVLTSLRGDLALLQVSMCQHARNMAVALSPFGNYAFARRFWSPYIHPVSTYSILFSSLPMFTSKI